MHEFSIGQSVVAAVLNEIRQFEAQGHTQPRLVSVQLAIGRFRQVVPESLQSAYTILIQGTPAEGSELKLRFIPIRMHCASCGWQGELASPPFICPQCASGDLETQGGMELHLENLEVEVPDETND